MFPSVTSLSDVTDGNTRKSSKDRSSSSSSSGRFVNRHGHHSRSIHIPAAMETGKEDVIQPLRTEMNETVHGRLDMVCSINTARHNVTAKPAVSKAYRISDLIPRNCEDSNDKGHSRHFMSDLHLWMQAWSDGGETMLVSVVGTALTSSTTVHLQ